MPKAPVRFVGKARGVRLGTLVLASLLVPPALRADDHIADVRGAGSFARGSSLWGGQVSVAWTLADKASRDRAKHWSAVVDFSAHGGTSHGTHLTRFTCMAGLRYVMPLGHNWKVVPFVQGLAGRLRDSDGPTGRESATVTGAGVGLDYFWKRTKTDESHHSGERAGAYAQFDYMFPLSSDIRSYPRVSLGLVIRISGPH